RGGGGEGMGIDGRTNRRRPPTRYGRSPRCPDGGGLPLASALIAAAVLSGCAVAPEAPPVPEARPEPPAVAVPSPAPRKPGKPKPKALPVRPLNVATDCRFADPTGYGASMRLDVAQSTVRVFEARVDVPKRGSCEFVLRDFVQTGSMPSVRLSAPGSRCAVHMWEQEGWVTVAFTDCAERCRPQGTFQYVWPIIADRAKGSCS
ncbi:MAG: hypothetical protein ACOZDY_04430, partial [Pseudomonadota bacterium]